MEKFMEMLRLLARKAIDDPRFVPVWLQEFRDLLERGDLGFHFQEEIRAIETADEFLGPGDLQGLFDVGAHPLGCGGGQGDTNRVPERVTQPAQLTVFRPEIMAPLRNTMGLVNGHAVDFHRRKQGKGPGAQQGFRGKIK